MKISSKNSCPPLPGVIAAVFAITFNLNTVIEQIAMQNTRYATFSLIVVIILFLCYCSSWSRAFTLSKIVVIYIIACPMLFLITIVVNRDSSVLYYVILLEIVKAILITRMLGFDEFINIYVIVISALAFVSITGFILYNVSDAFKALGVMVKSYGGKYYKSYGIFYMLPSANRNTGFLSEPGDWQHYVNIALLFELFYFHNRHKSLIRKFIPIVLTVASLTTLSPTGIIFSAIIWIVFLLNAKLNINNIVKYATILVIVIVAICSSTWMTNGLEYSFSKLNGSNTSSLSVRSYSIIAGLKVFLKNPIIGLGISKASTAMSQLFASQGLIYDQTSTTSAFLAMFGLLTAMLFTIPYFRLFKNSLGDKISYFSVILVLGGIFFSINNERFIYELTYYIFVVYGLVYVPEKLNQDEGEFI